MLDRLSDLLKKIKYEEGFPPTELVSAKKADLARRGMLTSSVATQVIAQLYFVSLEKVAKRFADTLIENSNQFGLASQEAIEGAIRRALDGLFVDVRGLLSRDFGGLGGEYEKYGITALESKVCDLTEYLQHKVTFRDLKPQIVGGYADAPTVTGDTSKTFVFIRDQRIRALVERDYSEILRANSASCWKSVIILSGGTIEAILTDLLQNDSRAFTAHSAPKKTVDITSWDLKDLINVSVELGLVGQGMEKLSHPVREYRNLVHPGNEIRNRLSFGEPEARIAIEVVHMLHRDLTPTSP